MTISTLIFSRVGICFEGFMVLRLFGPGTWWTATAKAEVRQVTQYEGVIAIRQGGCSTT
jgi:hypothetical protein